MNILFYVILRQLNQVCQSSTLSSEMIGNKTDYIHKQIILLNFNKFQFSEINNTLNGFSANVLAPSNYVSDVQS